MEIINPNSSYDFMVKRSFAAKISLLLLIISIGSLIYHKGPNWGVEFTGGTEIHVKYPGKMDQGKITESLKSVEYVPDSIQQLGLASDNEFLLRFSPKKVSFDQIEGFKIKFNELIETVPELRGAEIQRIDYIGPRVGKELVSKAIFSILLGCVGILLYLILRFELGFAMGAVIALIHDTIITMGAISIAGKEFTLAIVAAMLTVIGYSVNDTIVIFDRIRENLGKSLSRTFIQTANEGINQTLSRTILTSITVFIVLLPLFFLGGSVIHDFAFTLIVGVIIGTFSSVFVASAFVVYWRDRKSKNVS